MAVGENITVTRKGCLIREVSVSSDRFRSLLNPRPILAPFQIHDVCTAGAESRPDVLRMYVGHRKEYSLSCNWPPHSPGRYSVSDNFDAVWFFLGLEARFAAIDRRSSRNRDCAWCDTRSCSNDYLHASICSLLLYTDVPRVPEHAHAKPPKYRRPKDSCQLQPRWTTVFSSSSCPFHSPGHYFVLGKFGAICVFRRTAAQCSADDRRSNRRRYCGWCEYRFPPRRTGTDCWLLFSPVRRRP